MFYGKFQWFQIMAQQSKSVCAVLAFDVCGVQQRRLLQSYSTHQVHAAGVWMEIINEIKVKTFTLA